MKHLLHRAVTHWPVTAVAIGLPVIAAILYGCESRAPVVIDERANDAELCATLLEAGLDMSRPTALGLVGVDAILRNGAEEAAEKLSQWLRRPDCREASPAEPPSPEASELLTRLLGPEEVERVAADRVTPFDAAQIRDALLDFSAAEGITRDAETDLERVTRLFEYVTRTITPAGEGSTDLPLTAYEAHLFGRGSAEDRAWLFAALLRQLRIDAVVLRPGSGEGASDEAGPWWVGVLLDGGAYLFDPALGLPVPAPDSARAPSLLPAPATWAQAVEDPELLVSYRREAGFDAEPVAAESLRSPSVELIGPASYWKPAMERIELSLSGDRGVLLYDPLQDTAAGPGLFRRVARAGGSMWTEGAITVWPHTERIRDARLDLPESQRQRLRQRVRPYLGPVRVNTEGPAPVPEPPSKQLWETRIEHMSGRPGSAIGSYQQVRLAEGPDAALSPADQSLNELAADEAFYWTAHAQYGGGQYEAALETARDYVDRGGDRSDEAAALRALSLAAAGNWAEAAAAVAELPETTPGLARLRWLAERWKGTAAGEQAPE